MASIRSVTIALKTWGNIACRSLALVVCAALLLQARLARPATASIEVKVRDKVTQGPIQGAIIRIHAVPVDYRSPGEYLFNGQTDTHGRFILKDLDPDLVNERRFWVFACKSGYVEYPSRVGLRASCLSPSLGPRFGARFSSVAAFEKALGVLTISRGQVAAVAIDLERGGAIEGKISVRTPQGVVPFAGGGVLLQKDQDADETWLTPDSRPATVAAAACDGTGAFGFEDLYPSDKYSLAFFSDGYVSDAVEGVRVVRNQVTAVDRAVDHSDMTGVRGTVYFGGRPATPDSLPEDVLGPEGGTSAGTVTVGPSIPSVGAAAKRRCTARLAPDGSYSCLGLAPGTYALMIDCAPGEIRTFSVESQQTVTVDIHIPTAAIQ